MNFFFEDAISIDADETYTFIGSEKVTENVFKFEVDRTSYNFFAIGTTRHDVELVSLRFVSVLGETDLTPDVVVKNDVFYNGFLVNVNGTSYVTEDSYFLLTIRSNPNSFVQVGVEVVDLENDLLTLKDEITYHGYIDKSVNSSKCFYVPNQNGYIRMISKSGMKSYIADAMSAEEGTEVREFEQTIRETGYQITLEGEISKKFCLEPLADENGADYEIQYLQKTNSLNDLNPLINGLSYEFNLTKGEFQTYQYKKHLDSNKEIIFNVRAIEGHVDVRVLSVTDYPLTVINETVLASAERLIDLNGYFLKNTYHKGKNVWSNEQDILVVQCLDNEYNENNCRFEVAFFGEDDSFSMKSNLRYLQYLKEHTEISYSFSIKEDGIIKILIELSKITGDALMNVEKDDGLPNDVQTYYIGNKKVIEITSDQIDCSDMKGNYTIRISSRSGSVYSISYFLYRDPQTEINEIDIDGGMQILEYLGRGRSQVYKMQNLHKALQIPYVVNFLPLNCKIEVSFRNENNEDEQLAFTDHFIQHEITNEMSEVYSSDDYYYTIKASSMEHDSTLNYEGEMCLVQISSSSLDPEAEMIINEGTPVDFKFVQTAQHVSYVFPYIQTHEHIIAKVEAEIDTELIITYSINGNPTESIHFSKSEHFMIKQEHIYSYCNSDTICPITFNITATNAEDIAEGINIEFMVKSTNSHTPSYLKKFKVREDFIYADKQQYFMTDISPNEKGSVVLNFNRGAGYLLAKIVQKEEYEEDASESDWNGKVVLPSATDPETLTTFNHITGEFKFDESHTSKCLKGCELYIAVVPYESNLGNVINEFTIYVNSEYSTPKPVDVPINEYIHGAIYDTDEVKYYTFNVSKKVADIYIEFQTDACRMYLSEGTELPQLDETASEMLYNEASNKVYLFKSSTESAAVYTAGIKCDTISHVNYSPFIFRVRTVQVNEREIIDVKSNHETLCEIKERGFCYFIIPFDPEEYNGNIAVHAWAMDAISNPLMIFSNVVLKRMYDEMSQTEKESILPTNEFHTQSSHDNMIPELLDVQVTA